jgi:antitoxin MazE
MQGNQLVHHSARRPRAGWDTAFREMRRQGDDALFDREGTSTQWDTSEWKWQPLE